MRGPACFKQTHHLALASTTRENKATLRCGIRSLVLMKWRRALELTMPNGREMKREQSKCNGHLAAGVNCLGGLISVTTAKWIMWRAHAAVTLQRPTEQGKEGFSRKTILHHTMGMPRLNSLLQLKPAAALVMGSGMQPAPSTIRSEPSG